MLVPWQVAQAVLCSPVLTTSCMRCLQTSAAHQGLNYEEMMRTAEATMAVNHEAMAAQAQAAEAARASEAAAAAQANGESLML